MTAPGGPAELGGGGGVRGLPVTAERRRDRPPRTAGRRLGWATLLAALAATAAFVPPLVMPPRTPPAAAPAPTSPVPVGTPAASSAAVAPRGFVPISRHAADPANLRSGARIIECPSCEGGSRVGYIGGPNTLAIRVPDVPVAGTRTLTVTYETAEPRTLMITVNDGPVHTLTLTGARDWLIPARVDLRVQVPAGTAWIRFFNEAGSAPDINAIRLA
ncbi:hypothetical protein KZZ52_20905 [Dactylosporangium sp. AC04546]|uniref:hypothetical protein n=1 Tax=Dactylosporangium sp. AC04546 TaxID=2862460 RepID=UPI001EDE1018|nr:hypothetical protein [Dactylosporangium sp. AC04546]WVK87746.1 hypothetical protein KZZ52_20905 [Dactylosporangium sp. AC04546]